MKNEGRHGSIVLRGLLKSALGHVPKWEGGGEQERKKKRDSTRQKLSGKPESAL